MRILDADSAACTAAGSKAMASTAAELDSSTSEIVQGLTEAFNRRRESMMRPGVG